MGRMNGLVVGGVILALLGLLGFAMPIFTTQQTKEVAKIGDIKLQTTENTSHVIPPMVSGGTPLLCLGIIGTDLFTRRDPALPPHPIAPLIARCNSPSHIIFPQLKP